MTTNSSVQYFVRVIKEKNSALISAANDLLRELAGDNPELKKIAANKLLIAANELRTVLSQGDSPNWLDQITSVTPRYISGIWNAGQFITDFVAAKTMLEAHQWQFDNATDDAFDFDAIFEHYKMGSRLPQLFDEIVRLLEEIEASGEVDSISMLKALGKVIATIRKCKDGSYFSLNSAWEFLLSFLHNYIWGELSKLPGLGTALEALEKTIRETDTEMHKVHKQVQDEMIRTVSSEVKPLTNKSAFQFVAYNRSGYLLPPESSANIHDINA